MLFCTWSITLVSLQVFCQNANQTKLTPAGPRCAEVVALSWVQDKLSAQSAERRPRLSQQQLLLVKSIAKLSGSLGQF
jgi:hypothetical protein